MWFMGKPKKKDTLDTYIPNFMTDERLRICPIKDDTDAKPSSSTDAKPSSSADAKLSSSTDNTKELSKPSSCCSF
jgi:hypothetical protein